MTVRINTNSAALNTHRNVVNNSRVQAKNLEKLSSGLKINISTTNYGIDFLSSFNIENIFATQFHPEKSQKNGLMLLKNFLNLN